ncbi:MAG: hypothetical protein JXB10_07935 [Pirellulales bacterium]|nr:hypothetical protein [Pirellulales bacterium]
MRKYAMIGIAVALLGGSGLPAAAQQRPRMPKLQQAVRDGWLQFRMTSGRIVLETIRVNNLRLSPGSEKNKESLNIRGGNEEAAVDYEWSGPDERFVLSVADNQRLKIHWTPGGKPPPPPVVFVQDSRGKLELTVGSGAEARRYAAPTLWHLLLEHPDETRRCLLPCLELLQSPDGKLTETAAVLESELFRRAQIGVPVSRSQWEQWVAQLGDDCFGTRQAADRALRSCDVAVLSYLQQLDFRRLDAEQQFRLQRIIDAFSRQIDDDSAERTAAWLSGDPRIWLTLAARPEAALRRAAVKQLEDLLGEPVGIDPQADPETQKDRLAQLRRRLEEKP